jgi:hypothetical protein
MDCPACHVPMRSGDVRLESTGVGMLMAGMSYMELQFRDDEGGDAVTVLGPLVKASGYRCTSCGTVVLSHGSATDSVCLDCGAAMPAGVVKCSACGWTYLEA